jgi:hypothetical protein
MKLILFILWSRFKVDISNGIHDFVLFKFLKNMQTLTSYTLFDAQTLNLEFSFKIDRILFQVCKALRYGIFILGDNNSIMRYDLLPLQDITLYHLTHVVTFYPTSFRVFFFKKN